MPSIIPGLWTDFGMGTRAAYGGGISPIVYKVTSLSDDGSPGTFRYGAETLTVPRVIVFERGGYITLQSDLVISSPYVTIAGQTAPSPGITFKAAPLGFGAEVMIFVSTHDVYMGHVAIRPGGDTCSSGIQVYPGGSTNLVFDHVSMSWGQDENFAVFSSGGGASSDISFYRCLSGEGLQQTPGAGACPGGGAANGHGILVGGTSGNNRVALIENLFTRCLERTPYCIRGSFYVVNNVTFAGHEGHNYNGNDGTCLAIDVGNYIKRRNGSAQDSAYLIDAMVGGRDKIYLSGNIIDDRGLSPAQSPFLILGGADPRVGTPPFTAPAGHTPTDAATAYSRVLANVGSRPAQRDAVDTRLINDVISGNVTDMIQHQDDVGGYPSLASTSWTLTPPADPHSFTGAYTNLELWIHGYSAIVEGTATIPDITDADGSVDVLATFTGTNDLNLTAYTPETGLPFIKHTINTGNLIIRSNRVRVNSADNFAVYISQEVPISNEYDVRGSIHIFSNIPSHFYALWGRMSTLEMTGYVATYDGSFMGLHRYANDSFIAITSVPMTLAAGDYDWNLLLRNGSKSVELNTTPILYTTDNTITSTGRGGLSVYATSVSDGDADGLHFNSYEIINVLEDSLPSTLSWLPGTIVSQGIRGRAVPSGWIPRVGGA